MEEKMSIRAIKKRFHVGDQNARLIHQKLYGNIPVSPGRPPATINENEYNFVHQYKKDFNVGYQRLSNIRNQRPDFPNGLTEWKIRKIYDYDDIYVYGSEFKTKNSHEQRYVAKYAGQAWHTDLHYSEKYEDESFWQFYLIAFIDDRTRKIVHYEVIPDKTMLSTSKALENAFIKNFLPKTVIIDNGKEFTGSEFQDVLKRYGVESHAVSPYTPQENGKIERFWQTLEQSKPKEKRFRNEYLDKIINEYNTTWFHSGLKEITGENMTPEQAWLTMQHYNGQQDACYIKY